ncbi:hypothetical protein JW921_08385 [Candidatus Fermentibacterales bacterium]|nr:hypothetical protein [Candidatus Fermentibacterales bacterium]
MSLTGRILVAGCLLSAACGQGPGGECPADADIPGRTIVAVDSIGVEIGDSAYVFASIEATGHTIDGSILVLDRPNCCVREFTPEGEFVRQYGRRGSGPGELSNPHSMVRLGDGRVAVLDLYTGGMQTFDSEGRWQGISAEMTNEPVLWLTESEGNTYVGTQNCFDFCEQGLVVTAVVGRYEADRAEPFDTLWESSFVWDFRDITPLIEGSYFARTWASDRDGNVFIAPRSSEVYQVSGFDASGEAFLEISRELERVRKADEEMADEAAFWNLRAENMGASGPFNYQPDPYRWMIHSMGVDALGRLWVRRGTEETPTFDVFDMEGNQVFTATIPSIRGPLGPLWQIDIDEQGILAYSLDPEAGYQKLYVLELQD